jgi:hypothetical protein
MTDHRSGIVGVRRKNKTESTPGKNQQLMSTQFWAVTMLTKLIFTIYEEMELRHLLFELLKTCLRHPKGPNDKQTQLIFRKWVNHVPTSYSLNAIAHADTPLPFLDSPFPDTDLRSS